MGRIGPPGRRGPPGSIGEEGPKVCDSKTVDCTNVATRIFCRAILELREILDLEEVTEML